MAASALLAPEARQGSIWLPNPTCSPAGVELAKWAHGLIMAHGLTAYRNNNSKLVSIAQSGLSQLEVWRQRLDTPRGGKSLQDMHGAQQSMLRQLVDLEQQLAVATAAEELELQHSAVSSAAIASTALAALAPTSATAGTTGMMPAAAAETPTLNAASALTVSTAMAGLASPVRVSTATLGAEAADHGLQLTAWADGFITRNLGASRILSSARQPVHTFTQAPATAAAIAVQAETPVDLAKAAAGEAALAARGIKVVARDGASAAAALQQLQARCEHELQAFQAESDSVVRQLEQLQQQLLAHMHALSGAGAGTRVGALAAELGTWEVQWSKAHAEIRTLAATASKAPHSDARRAPATAALPAKTALPANVHHLQAAANAPAAPMPVVPVAQAPQTVAHRPVASPVPPPQANQHSITKVAVAVTSAAQAASSTTSEARQCPSDDAAPVPAPAAAADVNASPRSKPASWDVVGQMLYFALRAKGKR